MSSSRAEKIRQPEILSTEGDVNASRRILKVNVAPGDVADVLKNTAARHTHGNKSQLDLITDGAHESRTNNPHQVTKAQVGLGNVQDGAEQNVQSDWNETDTDSDAYIQNKPDVITSAERNNIAINTTHRSQTDNPHQVTKAQVGLGDVPNVDFTNNIEKLIEQDQWLFSPGVVEGGLISEGTNTGTFKVSAITKALLRTEASSTAPLMSVTLSEQDNQTIAETDVVYFVVFEYGNPCTISLQTTQPNGFNAIPIGKVLKNTDNKIHYITGGYNFGEGIKKLHTRAMSLRSLELKKGGTIAYYGTNNFTLTPGVAFGGINQYSLSAYNSADTQFTAIYNDGSGGWTEVKRNTIDYAHYDNLSGTLDTIKNNKFGVHYIYKHIDNQSVFTVYGLGSYSLAEAVAQAVQLPNVPLHLSEFGVFVGSIIVPQAGGSFTKIINPTTQFFDGTLASDHANLSNLDYDSSGHTGFANAGVNNNITSMTGLDDAGIPLAKVDGATSYPGSGEQAFLDADKSKLEGIEAGAEVNVQSDWNETDTGSDAFIQNKPDVITSAERTKLNSIETGAKNYPHSGELAFTTDMNGKLNSIDYGAQVNVQPDWNETDTGSDAFILNKPTIPVIPGKLHFERTCTSADNASVNSTNGFIRCSFSNVITNTFNQTTNNLFTCKFSGVYVFNFLAAFNGVNYGQVGSIGIALITPVMAYRIEWHPTSGNDSGQIHSRSITICVHLTADQTVYPSLEKWGGGAVNFIGDARSAWSGYCVSLD